MVLRSLSWLKVKAKIHTLSSSGHLLLLFQDSSFSPGHLWNVGSGRRRAFKLQSTGLLHCRIVDKVVARLLQSID